MVDSIQKKLHLGCGERDFGKEWMHIDGARYKHIERHDIKNLMFHSNTIEIIYASHVLEYFDRQEVKNIIFEWHRVLKPGGTLRLAVPNFAAMAKLYLENNDYSLDNTLGPLYGKMEMGGIYIYHKTIYDFRSLEKLLLSKGFEKVNLYDWRETEHSRIDDHSQAYFPHMDKENGTLISLNVEATK